MTERMGARPLTSPMHRGTSAVTSSRSTYSSGWPKALTWALLLERVKGIEPSLSAWELATDLADGSVELGNGGWVSLGVVRTHLCSPRLTPAPGTGRAR